MTHESRSRAGVGIGMAAVALAVVVIGLAVRPSGIGLGGPVAADPSVDRPVSEATPPSATPPASLSPEGTAAAEIVGKYLDGIATDHLNSSWLLLSDWSKRSVGSFQTFADGERRYAAARPNAAVVGPASRDPDLLDPAVLGARGVDLHGASDLARAWLVPIRWPEARGAPGRTENVIVAPAGDTVRIWIDVAPGGYGAWPYPDGCAAFEMSARRCDFAVDTAAANAGIDRSTGTSVFLLPDPGCDQGLDAGVLCKRSGGFLAVVRFEFADRDPVDETLGCNVGSPQLLCSETPMLQASDMHNGYWDVTCGGDDPATCPSPIAAPPGVAGLGRELKIGALDVPVGAVGRHEVLAGTAVLPGGVLSEGRFSIPNSVEDGYLIESDTVTMVLRSKEPGRPPFDNIYLRGVTNRAEAVDVFLVFDVVETSAGASFHVADLLVK